MNQRVLVVGAGPVGLIVGLELARYGIAHTIIDANPNKSSYSKALSVSAATLKVFHGLGLEREFEKVGKRIEDIEIYFRKDRCARINMRRLPSCYKYYLSLSQPETEGIIERRLAVMGTAVRYGETLIGLKQNDRNVEVQISNSTTKQSYQESYDIVVGCDGAQSTTRNMLGLRFEGEDYDAHMILGDVYFNGLVPERTSYHVFEGGFLIFLPMAQGLTRIVVGRPGSLPKGRPRPQAAELQEFLDQHYPGSPQIREVTWGSSTRFFSRIAETNTVGRVHLAGDAFHLFSPIGGQGMNTGVQDAVNLAWKIAFTLKGIATPALLESYNDERLLAVRRVLASVHDNTLHILQQAGSKTDKRPFEVRQENRSLYRDAMPQEFSGLAANHGDDLASLVGRHVPYFFLEGSRDVRTSYDIPKLGRNIVISPRDNTQSDLMGILRRFKDVLGIIRLDSSSIGSRYPLDIETDEICLVRPDGYVGFVGREKELSTYLKKLYRERR